VEKGKRIASLNLNHRIDTAFIQQPAKPKAMAQPAIKTMPAATIMLQQPQYPPSQQAQSSKGQAYTIQLASYKSNSHAQKEAAVLKQKGYSPLLLTKGEYIVLCVGNFSNKQNAQSLLPELSKRYGDCRIRRL
jgi:cell division septation protein DedD